MKAHVGDRLLPDGEQRRAGVIIGLQHADGSPPYVVKWLGDGHIALVFPGPYTKLVRGAPAGDTAVPAQQMRGLSGKAAPAHDDPERGSSRTL
jgi:Domain of unknown function (DUF1918)